MDTADKCLVEPTNMLIVNPTTPAQYFHALRRQMVRPFRKPLIVIAPKTLLRHAQAVSSLSDMQPGTSFKSVLSDTAAGAPPDAVVTRVVLVSGKLYYELADARRAAPPSSIAARTRVLRVEELSPFPTQLLDDALGEISGVKEVLWVQEEPCNAGAWTFAEAHLAPVLQRRGLSLRYVGRPALAAPAVGLSKRNAAQQAAVLAAAFA